MNTFYFLKEQIYNFHLEIIQKTYLFLRNMTLKLK